MRSLFFSLCALLACVAAQAQNDTAARRIKVMQLNIWHSGTSVSGGFDKLIDVILASDADFVMLSEVQKGDSLHARLVAALKAKAPDRQYYAKYAGADVGLISRFPIESAVDMLDSADPANKQPGFTNRIKAWRVTLPGGLKATVCSAHLDYRGYGLYLVRGYKGGYPDFGMIDDNKDGKPDPVTDPDKIMAYNRRSKRNKSIEEFIAFAKKEEAAGRQVILAGDFNEGSHLDWTERAKNSFGHNGVALPWDNSIALHKNGYLDAYRVIHPDEIKFPGFTWPAIAHGKKTTSWASKVDERDRIDFVYYGTGANKNFKPVRAWIVGPKAYFIGTEKVPNPGEDAFVCDTLPWPSDHAGVLIEFAW